MIRTMNSTLIVLGGSEEPNTRHSHSRSRECLYTYEQNMKRTLKRFTSRVHKNCGSSLQVRKKGMRLQWPKPPPSKKKKRKKEKKKKTHKGQKKLHAIAGKRWPIICNSLYTIAIIETKEGVIFLSSTDTRLADMTTFSHKHTEYR